MSVNPTTHIDAALANARTRGIVISRMACASWRMQSDIHSGVQPTHVNWMGAVLYADAMNEIACCTSNYSNSSPWSWKRLLAVLDVDTSWCYRFGIGFDQGRALSIIDDDMRPVGIERISAEGVRLARIYLSRS